MNPDIANDEDYVAELKSVTQDQYRQEVLGEFVDIGDALFPRYMLKEALVSTGHLRIPEGVSYYIGVDIARVGKDETVYALIAVNHATGMVYVVKTMSEAQSSITHVVDVVMEWCRAYPVDTVFMDETGLGAGAVDIASEKGVPVMGVPFSLKSKEEMYTNLRMLFENHRIKMQYIDKMFYQLSYLKREYINGRMKIKVDPSQHDDYPDALALGCKAVESGDRWAILEAAPNVL